MAKSQQLKDAVYYDELDRMRSLKRFPEVPVARQEMVRVMRDIATENRVFLHDLITFFVDECDRCPTAHELRERAATMRAAKAGPLGKKNCPQCGGDGWVRGVKMVKVSGMAPYEAEYSAVCSCRGGQANV